MRSEALETLLGSLRPGPARGGMIAIALLTLLAGHLYVIRPALAELRSLEPGNPEASLESLGAEVAETNAAIASTEQQLGELRDQLHGRPSDLPPEKTESYIVDRLDRISAGHTVELVSVKPGEARQVLMFDELLYEVEVRGEFFALVAWLRELERELRPLVVNEFSIEPETAGPRVGMKLRLASYHPRGDLS